VRVDVKNPARICFETCFILFLFSSEVVLYIYDDGLLLHFYVDRLFSWSGYGVPSLKDHTI
jgi:hypothetical protein